MKKGAIKGEERKGGEKGRRKKREGRNGGEKGWKGRGRRKIEMNRKGEK